MANTLFNKTPLCLLLGWLSFTAQAHYTGAPHAESSHIDFVLPSSPYFFIGAISVLLIASGIYRFKRKQRNKTSA